MNPPGYWRRHGTFQFLFVNDQISTTYGMIEYNPGRELHNLFPWYWQASVLKDARYQPFDALFRGYAPTHEAAQNIVETLLYETNTCEQPEDDGHGYD